MMTTALMIHKSVVPTAPPRPPSLESSHSSVHQMTQSKMNNGNSDAGNKVTSESASLTGQVKVDSSTTVLASSAANRIHLVSRQSQLAFGPDATSTTSTTSSSSLRQPQLFPLSINSPRHSLTSPNSSSSSTTSSSSPPMSSTSPSSSNSPSHLPHLLRSTSSPPFPPTRHTPSHAKLSTSSDSTSNFSAYSEESTTMTDEDDIVLDLSMPSRKRSYSPALSSSEENSGCEDQRRITRTSSSSSSGSALAGGGPPGANKPSYKKTLIKRYCKFIQCICSLESIMFFCLMRAFAWA